MKSEIICPKIKCGGKGKLLTLKVSFFVENPYCRISHYLITPLHFLQRYIEFRPNEREGGVHAATQLSLFVTEP